MFKRIESIKTYHSFTVDSSHHGIVFLKTDSASSTTTLSFLRVDQVTRELPPVVHPSGLSSERQWYLHDKIREYCAEESRDLTCPLPNLPRTVSSGQPSPERDVPEPGEEIEICQPTKRIRLCGRCGRSGHNSRTCKE